MKSTPESTGRARSRKFWGQILVVHPERLDDALLDTDVAHMRRNISTVLSLMRPTVGMRGLRPNLFEGRAHAGRGEAEGGPT